MFLSENKYSFNNEKKYRIPWVTERHYCGDRGKNSFPMS